MLLDVEPNFGLSESAPDSLGLSRLSLLSPARKTEDCRESAATNLVTSGFDPDKAKLNQPIGFNPAQSELAKTKSLLMLQGPVGPLFNRISAWKRNGDGQVHRIVFNGGDLVCCDHESPIIFGGSVEEWPAFLWHALNNLNIDGVLLFGQTRIYHQEAIRICSQMGVTVFVMEEGYIRPGFLTLETWGVNALSNTLSRYEWDEQRSPATTKPLARSRHGLNLTFHTARYYLALAARAKQFPKYRHHRDRSLLRNGLYWIKGALSLATTRLHDKTSVRKIKNTNANFFFIPLQLDTDSQIIFHSNYKNVWEFLAYAMNSFARCASDTDWLVIKQHPLARGVWGIDDRINKLAHELGIPERVIFIQDCRIHDLVNASAGVVTINSTVGIQAIYCARPLKVMGDAIYKVEGLADSQPVDEFWINPAKPDAELARTFYSALKGLTQVPGMLYDASNTPLVWSIRSAMASPKEYSARIQQKGCNAL